MKSRWFGSAILVLLLVMSMPAAAKRGGNPTLGDPRRVAVVVDHSHELDVVMLEGASMDGSRHKDWDKFWGDLEWRYARTTGAAALEFAGAGLNRIFVEEFGETTKKQPGSTVSPVFWDSRYESEEGLLQHLRRHGFDDVFITTVDVVATVAVSRFDRGYVYFDESFDITAETRLLTVDGGGVLGTMAHSAVVDPPPRDRVCFISDALNIASVKETRLLECRNAVTTVLAELMERLEAKRALDFYRPAELPYCCGDSVKEEAFAAQLSAHQNNEQYRPFVSSSSVPSVYVEPFPLLPEQPVPAANGGEAQGRSARSGRVSSPPKRVPVLSCRWNVKDDGSITGVVYPQSDRGRPLVDTALFLFMNGDEVAEIRTNAVGRFEFDDIPDTVGFERSARIIQEAGAREKMPKVTLGKSKKIVVEVDYPFALFETSMCEQVRTLDAIPDDIESQARLWSLGRYLNCGADSCATDKLEYFESALAKAKDAWNEQVISQASVPPSSRIGEALQMFGSMAIGVAEGISEGSAEDRGDSEPLLRAYYDGLATILGVETDDQYNELYRNLGHAAGEHVAFPLLKEAVQASTDLRDQGHTADLTVYVFREGFLVDTPLKGVDIQLHNPSSGETTDLTTGSSELVLFDNAGKIVVPFMEPGDYELSVDGSEPQLVPIVSGMNFVEVSVN